MSRERHLYIKYLTQSGRGPHHYFQYPLPSPGKAGAWIPTILRVKDPLLCTRGFHAVADHENVNHLLEWESDRAFVLEYEDRPQREDSKVVGGNCRLLAEVLPTGLVHPKAKRFTQKKGSPGKDRYDQLKKMLLARTENPEDIDDSDEGFRVLLRLCLGRRIQSTNHEEMDDLLCILRTKKETDMEALLSAFQNVFQNTWFDVEESFVNDSEDGETAIPVAVFRHAIEEARQLFKWSAPRK